LPQLSLLVQSALQPSPPIWSLSSQASPLSVAPFPHSGSQSSSVLAFATSGQHSSPFAAVSIGSNRQPTLQVSGEPT